MINAGLFCASPSGRTTCGLQFNQLGRRLSAAGLAGRPDIYEEPRTNLDLTVSRRMGGLKLKVAMEDLLGDDVRFVQRQETAYAEGGSVRVKARRIVQRSMEGDRTFAVSVSTGG